MADLKRRIVAEFSAVNKAKGATASFRRDMDSTGKAMKRMAGQALAMAGLGGGIYAVKRGFEAITKAAMTQERAERDLMAATQGSIAQFKVYASQMQSLTVYGDEQILTQMAYAKNLGVTTDRLQEAATAAIGLAARYRIDLAAAMMLVGRASSGQTQMLTRYGIIIDQNLSAQDKFNELLKIGAQSFRLAKEETLTAEGALAQLKNTYGDILEIIGEPMAEAMAKNARATKDWLESVKFDFNRYISDMAEGVEMMKQFDLAILNFYKKYSPLGLLYRKIEGPAPEPISKVSLELPEVIRFGPDPWEAWSKRIQERDRQLKLEKQLMEGTVAGPLAAAVEKWEELEKNVRAYGREFERAMEPVAQAPITEAEKAARTALQRTEERATEFAMTFRDVIASGFERSMRDASNWKEHMINMLEDVYWAAVRMAFLEPMAGVLATGMTKGLQWLLGPGIFATPAPTTPTVFTSPHGGPALQRGGTVERTGWAKVHKGETFSGVQGGGFEFHIHNEGQEKLEISRVESYMISDQRIIDVFTQRAQTDGPLRRSIKQATK